MVVIVLLLGGLMLGWIVGATVGVSLISLIGVLFLGLKEELLKKIVVFLVAFATGGMLGGALFHLLPEALEEGNSTDVFPLLLVGFMLFFIVEKFLYWRHCHDDECKVHGKGKLNAKVLPLAYLNLIGDAIHNFLDGAIIAISFMTNVQIGIANTIAIMMHEIPQEVGDFSVLIYSGMSIKKALLYNLLSGLTAVIGAVTVYILLINITDIIPMLLPIAAGGFIYIAAVDLTPELHKEMKVKVSAMQLAAMLIGIGLMYYIKMLGG